MDTVLVIAKVSDFCMSLVVNVNTHMHICIRTVHTDIRPIHTDAQGVSQGRRLRNVRNYALV